MPEILDPEILLEPYFSIRLNGTLIPEEMMQYVASVTYEDEQGKAGIAYINISDEKSLWMNDQRLTKGAKIELVMGHRRKNRVMLSGKIKNVEADFPELGFPSFIVICTDTGAQMTSERKTRSWKKRKRSDVVSAILRENGLLAVVQDSKTIEPHIVQTKETDMDFVKRQAKSLKWNFYKLPNGSYYFGAKGNAPSVTNSLDYRMGGGQIKNFRPTIVEEQTDPKTNNTTLDAGSNTEKPKDNPATDPNNTPQPSGTGYAVDKSTGRTRVINVPKGIVQN